MVLRICTHLAVVAPGRVQYHVNHNTCSAGRCLQRLDLSDNPMTGDVAEALAAMLQQQPHLRALNLNDTSLEDAGVSTIAQALANSGMSKSWHALTNIRKSKRLGMLAGAHIDYS